MTFTCLSLRPTTCYQTLKNAKVKKSCTCWLAPDCQIIQSKRKIAFSSVRTTSGTGSAKPQPSSSMSKEALMFNEKKDKTQTNLELEKTRFLQNYKPLADQTGRILQMLQNTSRQISEKAAQLYNDKINYFTKGKVSAVEGEEDWYSARVSFWMKRYEDAVGLTDVKAAQVRVVKTEKIFVKAQDDRRETQRLNKEVQVKIKNLHSELERTYRGEDKYLELVTLEHQVLKEERQLTEELSRLEREEREAFSRLSRAVRDSHESERAQAEKTKYWAVIGSVIGTCLGILGTTINNRLRMRELRQIVKEAAGGKVNSIGTSAAAVTVSSASNAHPNNVNVVDLKSAIIEGVQDKLDDISKKVDQIEVVTTEKISKVSKSICSLSENLSDQQAESTKTLNLLEKRPSFEGPHEAINKKAAMELQKSLETQLMLWEEKMDDIMKAHLDHSNRSSILGNLERKVTEVLTFEKERKKETARVYETLNRNTAIAFDAFQQRVNDIEEKLKDVRSLLLSQASLTDQTKVMINSAAASAAARTVSSNQTNQSAIVSKEAASLQKERNKEALAALQKSERIIVETVEISLKEHEDRLSTTLILNSVFVAVITPLIVYAINKIL